MQSHSIRPHEERPIRGERCGSPSHLISNRRATRWSARRELSVRLTGPNEHAAQGEPPAYRPEPPAYRPEPPAYRDERALRDTVLVSSVVC